MDDGADRMFFGRCLNGLCDDWESVESVCAGLGIGAGDAAGARAVGDCLRRAVEEGLAEAFDFREGAGFVRHDGGLEETAGLWFAITERGRSALEGMPEAWFAEADGTNGTYGTGGTGVEGKVPGGGKPNGRGGKMKRFFKKFVESWWLAPTCLAAMPAVGFSLLAAGVLLVFRLECAGFVYISNPDHWLLAAFVGLLAVALFFAILSLVSAGCSLFRRRWKRAAATLALFLVMPMEMAMIRCCLARPSPEEVYGPDYGKTPVSEAGGEMGDGHRLQSIAVEGGEMDFELGLKGE